MANNKTEDATLLVGIWLRGEEIERFLQYKEESTLTKNGTAGRKLLLERLNELVPKQVANPLAA
jgi:hypothetical protein